MIHRIVLLKLKEEYATDVKRREIAAHIGRELAAVPGVAGVDAGVPADDRSAESWDVSLLIRFESRDLVPAYIRNPAHRALVDGYIAPRTEFKKAWNFETP